MTTVKLDSKVGGAASAALEPHVPALYARPGVRIMAVMELAHVERTQPAPDSDKEASVKMRITSMEIPTREQESIIREAQRALYLERTATGTLGEDGELELTESTLKMTGALLHATEVARLRAGLAHWASYARRAIHSDMSHSDVLRELKAVSEGLTATLDRAAIDDQD